MMRPKIYPLLETTVEEGVCLGYRRAFKHNDSPTEEAIIDAIVHAVMLGISENFVFDE